MRQRRWLLVLCLTLIAGGCENCPKQDPRPGEERTDRSRRSEGITPPTGPIIIVDPNPGTGDARFRMDGNNCTDVAESTHVLNRQAIGEKVLFSTLLGGSPVELKQLRASFTHGGQTRELIVSKSGNQISWKLDGSVLAEKTYATDRHWREDLCAGTLSGSIMVIKDGETTEQVATDDVKIQVKYAAAP